MDCATGMPCAQEAWRYRSESRSASFSHRNRDADLSWPSPRRAKLTQAPIIVTDLLSRKAAPQSGPPLKPFCGSFSKGMRTTLWAAVINADRLLLEIVFLKILVAETKRTTMDHDAMRRTLKTAGVGGCSS